MVVYRNKLWPIAALLHHTLELLWYKNVKSNPPLCRWENPFHPWKRNPTTPIIYWGHRHCSIINSNFVTSPGNVKFAGNILKIIEDIICDSYILSIIFFKWIIYFLIDKYTFIKSFLLIIDKLFYIFAKREIKVCKNEG